MSDAIKNTAIKPVVDQTIALEKPEENMGRPTVLTEIVIRKLIAAFQRGHPVGVCLRYAGIKNSTYYDHMRDNEDFSDRIKEAQDYGRHLAGNIILDTLNGKDINPALKVNTAKWYLERKEPEEYGRKPEIENPNQTTNNYLFISDAEFKRRAEIAGVTKLDPARIAKALENGNVERRVE